jgi:hypothetical protein
MHKTTTLIALLSISVASHAAHHTAQSKLPSDTSVVGKINPVSYQELKAYLDMICSIMPNVKTNNVKNVHIPADHNVAHVPTRNANKAKQDLAIQTATVPSKQNACADAGQFLQLHAQSASTNNQNAIANLQTILTVIDIQHPGLLGKLKSDIPRQKSRKNNQQTNKA